MLDRHRIGFIGCGNMARSLIGGLLQSGLPRQNVTASDPDDARRSEAAREHGIAVATGNDELARRCDVCVLAVKPQVVEQALTPLRGALRENRPLLISVAAGVTTAGIERWSGGECPVIRAMPNTPALVRCGASAMFGTRRVEPRHRRIATAIMEAVGIVVWVQDETRMDTVTALSGSGPAYFFYTMEALVNAAVRHGLDARDARALCVQTARGAARLAAAQDRPLARLRENVTSPGGTTERGLEAMRAHGFEALIDAAFDAAWARSRELAVSLSGHESGHDGEHGIEGE